MKKSCSLLGFAAWIMSGVAACAGLAKWNGDQLVVTAGDYQVEFRDDCARTIGRILFRDEIIVNRTGAHQAVINVKGKENPREWIGTCHGGEEIEAFDLYVDGKPAEPGVSAKGSGFKVVKKSRLGPVAYLSEVEISEQGIRQVATFERTALEPDVNMLYPFMHCWSKNFTHWLAVKDDGIEEDVFYGDNRYLLDKDVLAFVAFDEKRKIGAYYRYPKIYGSNGRLKGKANRLWSRPIDHKLYLRVDGPKQVGEVQKYECRITAFEADAAGWKEKAQALMGKEGEQ